MSTKNILSMHHITMQFGGVVAVNDLSLKVDEGEIVALIGPNGAGKTTAFNCVTGIYEPTNGKIVFNGETILASSPKGRMKKLYLGEYAPFNIKPVANTPDMITAKGIARTFQNIRLFHNLTVFDNVLIAKHMRAKQNVFSATLRLDYKLTIFMIEHHMDLVMQISDRIYVLDFGKLIAEGTPEEIQNNEHVIDAYLGVVEEDA